MYELMLEKEENIVGLKAKGKLVDADYKDIVPKIDAKIEEVGNIRIMFDMTELEGWSCKAMLDDAEFGISHRKQMDKIAVIGDKKWEEDSILLCRPFFAGEVKFFYPEDKEAAWEWLKA